MDRSPQVKIFDTTLRDGQQCPGAGMSFEANIDYAHLATQLRLDVIEAGFPAASEIDFAIVKEIANQIGPIAEGPQIAALCQLRDEQIDRTIAAVIDAAKYGKAKMHTYVPVDPELMKASLGSRIRYDQIQQMVYDFVSRAVQSQLAVEFSPEGYSRMGDNFDFVTDLIRAAVSAGASVINCPDTVGGSNRLQGEEYFVEKMRRHAAIIDTEFPDNQVTWSVHCHNDFGLAVENSLQGVLFGPARQIEGCINGVGERAGNAALEQCIMLLKHFPYQPSDAETPLYTRAATEHLQRISDFIDQNMLPRQPHSPIVGKNAARHSSGGHTNAVLKSPLIYQPFDPKEVGKQISLAFGPLSGGNHAKSIILKRGYVCDDSEKAQIAQFIKNYYADRRKGITDEELILAYKSYRSPIDFSEIDYSKTARTALVSCSGRFFGDSGNFRFSHEGKDSALAALKMAIDERFPGIALQSHKSKSHGESVHAVSVSTIVVSYNGNQFRGTGNDQDIELSAMKALVDAINNCYVESHFRSSPKQPSATPI